MSDVAPVMPLWVFREKEAAIQVDGRFVNCVAFLGFKTEKGFSAVGTAFFVILDQQDCAFHYLVSYLVTGMG